MKNISIRLILLVLLIVVGPIIQKKIMGIPQKGPISMPNADADQSSLDEEKQECDYMVISPYLKSLMSLTSLFSFISGTSILQFSLPEKIVLPPPKF